MSQLPAGTRESSRIDVVAPSETDAARLLQELQQCHGRVVRTGRDAWIVRAQPWREDARTINAALTAVERWLVALGIRETTVVIGERRFTLSAPSGADATFAVERP